MSISNNRHFQNEILKSLNNESSMETLDIILDFLEFSLFNQTSKLQNRYNKFKKRVESSSITLYNFFIYHIYFKIKKLKQ